MKFSILALTALALFQSECFAYGEPRIYARSQLKCDPTAGVVGAVVGGVLDIAIRGRRTSPGEVAVVAGITGLATYGLSCKEEVVYLEKIDRHLHDREYRRHNYHDNDVEVTVLRSGYNRRREICRTYYSEIHTPRGIKTQESTACWRKNEWRHGFDRSEIVEESYSNSNFKKRAIPDSFEEEPSSDATEMEQFHAWKAQRDRERRFGESEKTRVSSPVTRAQSLDDGSGFTDDAR